MVFKKEYLFLGILIVSILTGCSDKNLNESRIIEVINRDWQFYKGELADGCEITTPDVKWEKINLPHTWNVDDSFDHRGVDDGLDITFYYYRGPGWYRKWVYLPETDSLKRIFIKFEAANAVADVWVNGKKAGHHVGGYTAFQFEITDLIKFGRKNLISVRVDNSYNYNIPPIRADYTMYGGIYRDVYLIKRNLTSIDQIHISTPGVSEKEGKIEAEIRLSNKRRAPFTGKIALTVFDPEKKQVFQKITDHTVADDDTSTIVLKGAIETPELWSPDSPARYLAVAKIIEQGEVIDEVQDYFGFRWYRFDADSGFFLNGKRLRLHGVNRHQDRKGYGNALSNKLHVEDMALIKSIGANFVRLAHYPQDQAVLNACDSLGLLVWQEIPVVTTVGKEEFHKNAMNMMREMVNQYYNHPSIIIWGLMNETVRKQPEDQLFWTVDLCKKLNKIAKEMDPYRYTAQAQFADRGTDILEVTDISGWNRYFGWYEGKFEDFGTFMDEQKRKNPHHIFIISEYGAGSKLGYHKENPTEPDFSENWQIKFHKAYWKMISERPWIAGSAVWNMFDFASDEKGGNIPHINQKGLCDFSRKPKDVFYFYQSVWTEEPMIYIVSHTWPVRKGRPGELKQVEVFSNCEEVELFLNEKSLGKKHSPFVWQVQFQEGKNTIEAVGTKQGVEVKDHIIVQYEVE